MSKVAQVSDNTFVYTISPLCAVCHPPSCLTSCSNVAAPQLGLAASCHQLNFTVLERNKSAQDFYLQLGCVDITASTGQLRMRCEGEALQHLADTLTQRCGWRRRRPLLPTGRPTQCRGTAQWVEDFLRNEDCIVVFKANYHVSVFTYGEGLKCLNMQNKV